MYISRIVICNFRNFKFIDIPIQKGCSCLIGENNTGKTNLLHALRLAIDSNLSSSYRLLSEHDIHAGVTLSNAEQVIISIEFSDNHRQST